MDIRNSLDGLKSLLGVSTPDPAALQPRSNSTASGSALAATGQRSAMPGAKFTHGCRTGRAHGQGGFSAGSSGGRHLRCAVIGSGVKGCGLDAGRGAVGRRARRNVPDTAGKCDCPGLLRWTRAMIAPVPSAASRAARRQVGKEREECKVLGDSRS